MKVARIRLLIASLLLLGWLSWLAYLAWFKTNPVVVSRSQVMASTYFVLADVTVDSTTGEPKPEVSIKEDLRPLGTPIQGTIRVRNIKEARPRNGKPAFAESGPYLLMLTKLDEGVYELAYPPRGPGAEGIVRPQPWVYRWEEAGVQEQFQELVPEL